MVRNAEQYKFKYLQNGFYLKCYATINSKTKNKIDYIHCHPLYQDDKSLEVRRLEYKDNNYFLSE